jgi:hypothetical protein
MNTQIVKEMKSLGYPLKVVKKSEFPDEKWTVREVTHWESTIPRKAWEGYEILESHTKVRKLWLYEEIERPLVVPWKALGAVLGTAALVVGGIALLPFVLVGVALVAAIAIDPVLVAELESGECVTLGWWFHSSTK